MDLTGIELVEDILLGVELPEGKAEADEAGEGKAGKDGVVPDQVGVFREGNECLLESSSDGRGEEEHGHDERTHRLGCLGESVLETSDGSKNLGNGDEHVRAGLDPNADGSRDKDTVSILAGGGSLATWRLLVDVVLNNGSPDHGKSTSQETKSDLLEGSEVDTGLAKSRVEEEIEDGDEDDKGEGVEVGDDLVGQAIDVHGGSLRDKVVGDLVVSEPVEGEPEEDSAGLETTTNLVNPGIVKGHPLGLGLGRLLGGLGALPEVVSTHVLHELDGVGSPTALGGKGPKAHALGKNRAGGGSLDVVLGAKDKDGNAESKDDGRQGVGKPETNVLFGEGHTELTTKSTDIDEKVEVHEDTADGQDGVNNDTLAGFEGLDGLLGAVNLLGNQRADGALEPTRSYAHNDDGNDEASHGTILVVENGRKRRNDEENVTNHGNEDGDAYGLETTPAGIGKISTKNGHEVDPEGVEGSETSGGLLTLAEGTRLVIGATGTSTAASRTRLLDEVLEDLNTTIVGETLCKLTESNGVSGPGELFGDTSQSGKVLFGGGDKVVVRNIGLDSNATFKVSSWVKVVAAAVSFDAGDVEVTLGLGVASDGVVLDIERHAVQPRANADGEEGEEGMDEIRKEAGSIDQEKIRV